MLEDRLHKIEKRIAVACERAGRDRSSVTLVAVSKTHPPETVNELARLGVRDFGESKIQEAKAKIPLCSASLRWHGIGHLQTNKTRDAVHLFSFIHSVDSLKLAHEIERQADLQSRRLSILLEVNVSGEASKFGLKPEALIETAGEVNQFPHLELRGLMGMAPYSDEAERARPFFRQLADLKTEVEQKLGLALPDLSMGMSGDFEVGIEEGATLVRVGTALFGERQKPFRTPEPDLN